MSTSDEQGNNLVMVDLAELGRGLETAFTGIAMVFASLGKSEAEVAEALSNVEMPTAAGKHTEEPAPTDKTAEASDDKPPEQPAPQQKTESKPPSDTPPTVTQDDITKVIVAKIKQKRGNNAKIGALLKTYGVEKVSSLPEEKYEAFLTDISQL